MIPPHNNPQGTAGSEQPKEYIITEDELDQFNENYNDGDWGNPSRKPLDERVRSRPHTSTTAPVEMPCLPNTPVCDTCYKDQIDHDAAIRAEAARKAREDVLKEVRDLLDLEKYYENYRWVYQQVIESLRRTPEQPKEHP